MGTAQVQGDLWGARAQDWAALQERCHLPAFEIVLRKLALDSTTRYLDIGCGTGLATQLAALHGAQVSGLDASTASIEIARERVPGGQFAIGEMEELPYSDRSFDAVTAFQAFQYAANPARAFEEARRVTRPGGKVAMVLWGRPEKCEMRAIFQALSTVLTTRTRDISAPLDCSDTETIEQLLHQVGLRLVETGEVDCPFEYPNEEMAFLAIGSWELGVRAMRAAGEERVREAVLESLAHYKRKAGGYRLHNTFVYFLTLA